MADKLEQLRNEFEKKVKIRIIENERKTIDRIAALEAELLSKMKGKKGGGSSLKKRSKTIREPKEPTE